MTTFEFYEGQSPTTKNLTYATTDKAKYSRPKLLVYQLLKSIGFMYRRMNNSQHFLLGRTDFFIIIIASVFSVTALDLNGENWSYYRIYSNVMHTFFGQITS
jgi:hypothetical protein